MKNLIFNFMFYSTIAAHGQVKDSCNYTQVVKDLNPKTTVVDVYDLLGNEVDATYKGIVVLGYIDKSYKKYYFKK